MKLSRCAFLISLLFAWTCAAQSQTTNLQLRLEPRTNGLDLIVDGVADVGALFIYRASDLQSLSASPAVAVQTNTSITNGLRFSLPPPGAASEQMFFKATHWPSRTVEELVCGGPGMVVIPSGSFAMGDPFNDRHDGHETPVHTVQVGGFCMDKYEVTKALWDEVYGWAITHGYTFDYANSGQGKAANHPAHSMTWYDCVKWCNARSEKEGRVPAYYTSAAQTGVYRSGQVGVQNDWVKWNTGYRLPTESEWEKAARGGSSGHRFPWSDVETITHSQANYYSSPAFAYDISPTRVYHPSFQGGGTPNTSPAGYFAPNGDGLYDMAGNVWEWCWDWYGSYGAAAQTDPRGPVAGSGRVIRGGGWNGSAIFCRSADRNSGSSPDYRGNSVGFRAVLAPGQ